MTSNKQADTKNKLETTGIDDDIQNLMLQHTNNKGEVNVPKRLVENFITLIELDIKRLENRRELYKIIKNA